jgi:hypothetical protein
MQKKSISRDVALAEITLRKYEKPENFKGRELVRKICLSLGLLQPGDSRDVIVDVLSVMLKGGELSSEEIEKQVISERKKHKLKLLGIAGSNIRRQLKRLRDLFIIEKIGNNYRMNEKASLDEIFEEKIEKFLIPSIVNRVKEYIKAIKPNI